MRMRSASAEMSRKKELAKVKCLQALRAEHDLVPHELATIREIGGAK